MKGQAKRLKRLEKRQLRPERIQVIVVNPGEKVPKHNERAFVVELSSATEKS